MIVPDSEFRLQNSESVRGILKRIVYWTQVKVKTNTIVATEYGIGQLDP